MFSFLTGLAGASPSVQTQATSDSNRTNANESLFSSVFQATNDAFKLAPPQSNPAHRISLSTLQSQPPVHQTNTSSVASAFLSSRRGSDFITFTTSRRRSSAANWDTLTITSAVTPPATDSDISPSINSRKFSLPGVPADTTKASSRPEYSFVGQEVLKNSQSFANSSQFGSLRRMSTRASFLGPSSSATIPSLERVIAKQRVVSSNAPEMDGSLQKRVFDRWGSVPRNHRTEFSMLLDETEIARLHPDAFLDAKMSGSPDIIPVSKAAAATTATLAAVGFSELLIRTLMGHLSVVGTEDKPTVRIFVSSEVDCEWERNSLLVDVYPYLRNLCRRLNLELQIVDLRALVYNPQTLNAILSSELVISELRESLDTSAAVGHVAILGNKYGKRPLPSKINHDEFDRIINYLIDHTPSSEEQTMNRDLQYFLKHYTLVPTAIPPHYQLCAPYSLDSNVNYSMEQWAEIEARMIVLLRRAAFGIPLRPEEQRKYFMSMLHEEVSVGIKRASEDPTVNTFCCFRRDLQGLDTVGDFSSLYIDTIPSSKTSTTKEIDTDAQMRHGFMIQAIEEKIKPDDRRSFVVPWRSRQNQSAGSLNVGFNPLEDVAHEDYIRDFCDDFCWNVSQSILLSFSRIASDAKKNVYRGVAPKNQDVTKALYQEVIRHQRQVLELGGLQFVPIKSTMQQIDNFFSGRNKKLRMPLIIIGEEGSGKSTLLGAAGRCAFHHLPHAVIVNRYCGLTVNSVNARDLVLSIVRQIAYVFGVFDRLPAPGDWHDTVGLFKKALALATEKTPVVLILDSIDRISPDADIGFDWLLGGAGDSTFPKFAYIVVSVSSTNRIQSLGEMQKLYVGNLEHREIRQMVARYEEMDCRRLIAEHQTILLEMCVGNPTPMYVRLAWEVAKLWKDDTPVSIGATVDELVEILFNQAEKRFGTLFVARALGYITGARRGLTLNELDDVLSCDEDVLAEIYVDWSPPVRRIPQHHWLRLREYLGTFLTEENSNGAKIYAWAHQCFARTAERLYLDSNVPGSKFIPRSRAIHDQLADYFCSRWAKAPKPYVESGSSQKTELRYIADQPIFFPEVYYPNRRRTEMLAYHQIQAGRRQDVITTLTDFQVLLANARLRLIEDSLAMYDLATEKFPDISETLAEYKAFLTAARFYLELDPDSLHQSAANLPATSEIAKEARRILSEEQTQARSTIDSVKYSNEGAAFVPTRWLNWLNRPHHASEPTEFSGTGDSGSLLCGVTLLDDVVACIGRDFTLRLIVVPSGQELRSVVIEGVRDALTDVDLDGLAGISFSPNGLLVAVAWGAAVWVYETKNLELMVCIKRDSATTLRKMRSANVTLMWLHPKESLDEGVEIGDENLLIAVATEGVTERKNGILVPVAEIVVWDVGLAVRSKNKDFVSEASLTFEVFAEGQHISALSSKVFCFSLFDDIIVRDQDLAHAAAQNMWLDTQTGLTREGVYPPNISTETKKQFSKGEMRSAKTWAISADSCTSIIQIEEVGGFIVLHSSVGIQDEPWVIGSLPKQAGTPQNTSLSNAHQHLVQPPLRAIADDGQVIAIVHGTEIQIWMLQEDENAEENQDISKDDNVVPKFTHAKTLYAQEALDWLKLSPDGRFVLAANSLDPDAQLLWWDLSIIPLRKDHQLSMEYVWAMKFADDHFENQSDLNYDIVDDTSSDDMLVVVDPHGSISVTHQPGELGGWERTEAFSVAEGKTSVVNLNGLMSTILETAIVDVDIRKVMDFSDLMFIGDNGTVGIRMLSGTQDPELSETVWKLPVSGSTCCSFIPSHDDLEGQSFRFVTGHKGGEVMLWNARENEDYDPSVLSNRFHFPRSIGTFTHGHSWVLAVSVSHNGEFLSSIATNGSILVIPLRKILKNGEDSTGCYYLHHAQATCLSFSVRFPVSAVPMLASGSSDGSICVWGLRDNNVMVLPGHSTRDGSSQLKDPKSVLTIKWVPGTSILASVGEDYQIKFWNVNDGQQVHSFSLEWINSQIITTTFNFSCHKLAVADGDGRVYVLQIEGLKEIIESTSLVASSSRRSSAASPSPTYRPGSRQRRSQTSKALPYTDHHRSLLNIIHSQNRKYQLWPNESTSEGKHGPYHQTYESIQGIITAVVTPPTPLPAGCYSVEWDIEIATDAFPVEDMVFIVVCIGKREQTRVRGFRRYFTKKEQEVVLVERGKQRVFLGYVQVLWPSTMHISFGKIF
ncbi:hypothetical protein HK096_003059 [Nowakowskiella sp. JEL0078]|nr:hypothetical protein HK096_003059 [Nowakowskiella sp. JEL0078]